VRRSTPRSTRCVAKPCGACGSRRGGSDLIDTEVFNSRLTLLSATASNGQPLSTVLGSAGGDLGTLAPGQEVTVTLKTRVEANSNPPVPIVGAEAIVIARESDPDEAGVYGADYTGNNKATVSTTAD
jgi:hypothetical protein